MKTNLLYIIFCTLLFCVCACRSEYGGEDDDMFVFYQLTTSNNTTYVFPMKGGNDSIIIHANCKWSVDVDCNWVHVDKDSCEGDGTLRFYVEENPMPVARYSVVEISAPSRARIIKLNIKQDGSSKLFTYSSYDQAVGYSYDMTADYPNGAQYAVFDIPNLDYMQYVTGHSYIVDSDQPEMTQEVFTASSQKELNDKIAATIGVGITYNGVTVEVEASVDYKTLETKNRQYGLKKVRRTVFMRNLQYMNVVADAMEGKKGLFAPAFESDWTKLMECRSQSDVVVRREVQSFLKKWGVAFVSTSMMGASFDYEVEVESSVLSKEFTIEVAVGVSLASVVNVDLSGYYTEKLTTMKEHYNKRMVVRGGDAKIMSILNTGGQISSEMYEEWQNSVLWKDGLMSDNAVLFDVKLVSFAELFVGNVKEEMKRQIEELTNRNSE